MLEVLFERREGKKLKSELDGGKDTSRDYYNHRLRL